MLSIDAGRCESITRKIGKTILWNLGINNIKEHA